MVDLRPLWHACRRVPFVAISIVMEGGSEHRVSDPKDLSFRVDRPATVGIRRPSGAWLLLDCDRIKGIVEGEGEGPASLTGADPPRIMRDREVPNGRTRI